MNKWLEPASVGLRSYQLEDGERLKDPFKTHRANRGDARNSRKRHYGTTLKAKLRAGVLYRCRDCSLTRSELTTGQHLIRFVACARWLSVNRRFVARQKKVIGLPLWVQNARQEGI